MPAFEADLPDRLIAARSLIYGYWREVAGPKENEPEKLIQNLTALLNQFVMNEMKQNIDLQLPHAIMASVLLIDILSRHYERHQQIKAQAAGAASGEL